MSNLEQTARRMLLSRRAALAKLYATTVENEDPRLHETEADWPDRAATLTENAVLDRLSARERTELQAIEAALLRMRQGTWGRCTQCGGAIGTQRLRALPEATRCIGCTEE